MSHRDRDDPHNWRRSASPRRAASPRSAAAAALAMLNAAQGGESYAAPSTAPGLPGTPKQWEHDPRYLQDNRFGPHSQFPVSHDTYSSPIHQLAMNPSNASTSAFGVQDWGLPSAPATREPYRNRETANRKNFNDNLAKDFQKLPKNAACEEWITTLREDFGPHFNRKEYRPWCTKVLEIVRRECNNVEAKKLNEPEKTPHDLALEMAAWNKEEREKNRPKHSIGHRTARIYRLDREAWIRAHNPRLAAAGRAF